MFEIRTALSYLLPRKKQLSASVVGLIAVFVILTTTWLTLVFFSTTEGFENRWTQKIVGILGSVRIVPTAEFYDSPQQQLDVYSSASGFLPRRLSQKAEELLFSYKPTEDPALPASLQEWYSKHHQDINPAYSLVNKLNCEHLPWHFFEATVSHVFFPSLAGASQKSLSQYAYIFGVDALRTPLLSSSTEMTPDEFSLLLTKLHTHPPDHAPLYRRFISFLGVINVVAAQDIDLPASSMQVARGTELKAVLSYKNEPVLSLFSPKNEKMTFPLRKEIPPIALPKPMTIQSTFLLPPETESSTLLSCVRQLGYPILLPKNVRQQGVRFFDTGSFQLSHGENTPPLSIPFYVAGFFDPGILPTGGKFAITSREAVVALQPELTGSSPFVSSGIIIDTDISSIEQTTKALKHVLEPKLAPLFTAQRYDQYELTTELYQQLSSEKLLFRLLSFIIIAVACSNIFSMLFILAHDRRKEIAVMRALGASRASITVIFLITGMCAGLFGSLLGAGIASLTLHYLPNILSLIGKIQGHELLQQTIYGDISSQSLSSSTLLFALISVSIASAAAGACAATRACRINISESLKGGG